MRKRWLVGFASAGAVLLGAGLALSQSVKVGLLPFLKGGEVRLYSYALQGSLALENESVTLPWIFDDSTVVEVKNIEVDPGDLVERLEPASATVFVNDVPFQDLVVETDGILRAHLPRGWTSGMRSFRLEAWDAAGQSIFIMGGNGIIAY